MSAFKGDIRSEDTVICSVEPSRNVNRLQWVLILDIFILKKFKTVVATPQGVFPSAHFSKRKVFTEQWVKKTTTKHNLQLQIVEILCKLTV